MNDELMMAILGIIRIGMAEIRLVDCLGITGMVKKSKSSIWRKIYRSWKVFREII